MPRTLSGHWSMSVNFFGHSDTEITFIFELRRFLHFCFVSEIWLKNPTFFNQISEMKQKWNYIIWNFRIWKSSQNFLELCIISDFDHFFTSTHHIGYVTKPLPTLKRPFHFWCQISNLTDFWKKISGHRSNLKKAKREGSRAPLNYQFQKTVWSFLQNSLR